MSTSRLRYGLSRNSCSCWSPNLQVSRLKINDSNQMIKVYNQLMIKNLFFLRHFNSSASEFVKHITAFYNGIDLMFRQITGPKIRLNITGIIIALVIFFRKATIFNLLISLLLNKKNILNAYEAIFRKSMRYRMPSKALR